MFIDSECQFLPSRTGSQHVFWTYEQARNYLKIKKLASRSRYDEFVRTSDAPSELPRSPRHVYHALWSGWGDFLGTETICTKLRKFKSYEEAKAWLAERGITSLPAMLKLRDAGQLPSDIPRSPKDSYKLYWKGSGDFFGTGKARRYPNAIRSYQDSVEFLAGLHISSRKEFKKLKDEGAVPEDIPTTADIAYRAQWRGWGEFLGSGNVAACLREFKSYNEAKAWIQEHRLVGRKAHRKFSKDGRLPLDIPSQPDEIYAEEWEGWPTYLGYVSRRGNQTAFLKYSEAAAWAQAQKIQTSKAWLRYPLPKNLPVAPNLYYLQEWEGWSAFLGNKRKNGTSVVERILAAELSHFLQVDSTIQSVPLGNGKQKRPDIVVPAKRLILEFDGSYWHKNLTSRDSAQTKMLEKQGWAVVRVREQPLQKLFDNDVCVRRNAPHFEVVTVVLRHLASLGFIQNNRMREVDEYVQLGHLRAAESDVFSTANWRAFDEARTFARTLDVTSDSTWQAYWNRPGNRRPEDLPSHPSRTYSMEWVSRSDFYRSA